MPGGVARWRALSKRPWGRCAACMLLSLEACWPCWVHPSAGVVTRWGKRWRRRFRRASRTRIGSFARGLNPRRGNPSGRPSASRIRSRPAAIPPAGLALILTWLPLPRISFWPQGLRLARWQWWISARPAARTSFIPIVVRVAAPAARWPSSESAFLPGGVGRRRRQYPVPGKYECRLECSIP